jgi:RNA-directed DNA polymerase
MATQSNLPEGTRPADRQGLYDLIRDDQPSLPEQLITREGELNRELNALLTEKRRVEDREALLKQLRKERMAESRRKREENKLKRIQARKDKTEQWQKEKTTKIIYLGEGVSAGLNHEANDDEKLAKNKLPAFANAEALATAMGITVGELRFLSFNRQVSRINHYMRFSIPKKTGGERKISAPMRRLKGAQYWILQNILERVALHESAHGFVHQRSIVSNAKPHVAANLVINMDLKDFFPTITMPRVKGVFQKLGYSEAIASILALLCTEAEVDEIMLDEEKWYVGAGDRFLPQGAPTSPAITNILCYRLDCRMEGLAKKFDYTYTRYADDLTFSCNTPDAAKNINAIKKYVLEIVENEGFTLHPNKTKVMRNGAKKEVTGIVVNEKPSLDRKKVRQFRALLHQIDLNGPVGKSWGKGKNLRASLMGFAHYIAMVDAEKGKKYIEKVEQIFQKWGAKMPNLKRRFPTKRERQQLLEAPFVAENTPQVEDKKKWWKIW